MKLNIDELKRLETVGNNINSDYQNIIHRLNTLLENTANNVGSGELKSNITAMQEALNDTMNVILKNLIGVNSFLKFQVENYGRVAYESNIKVNKINSVLSNSISSYYANNNDLGNK